MCSNADSKSYTCTVVIAGIVSRYLAIVQSEGTNYYSHYAANDYLLCIAPALPSSSHAFPLALSAGASK